MPGSKGAGAGDGVSRYPTSLEIVKHSTTSYSGCPYRLGGSVFHCFFPYARGSLRPSVHAFFAPLPSAPTDALYGEYVIVGQWAGIESPDAAPTLFPAWTSGHKA